MQSQSESTPRYIPVTKWNEHYEWPPIGGLRHIIFNAETNGFAPAIKRVGRSVLMDAPKFWEIVEQKNEGAL
jgi:hypothetical protein